MLMDLNGINGSNYNRSNFGVFKFKKKLSCLFCKQYYILKKGVLVYKKIFVPIRLSLNLT